MKNVKFAAAMIAAALSLQGCSLLYPNWGATSFPTESSSASQSPSPTETKSETPTETAKPSEPAKIKVTVEINDFYVDEGLGVFDVIAEVTDVFEEGGTCALTVTSGSTTATATAKAGQNVTSTQCGLLEVNLSDLASGTAQFRVSYTSPTSAGKSALGEVTIP